MSDTVSSPAVAVIGAGPAGLLAAEVMAHAGLRVVVFDTKASAGRKLLRAGIGGLNLTHAEPLPAFTDRYGEASSQLASMLARFGPAQLLDWVHGLGIETFVGSSQRVFPMDKKAAPLLRAWLHRLRSMGVEFHMHWRWLGWEGDDLQFETPSGLQSFTAQATVLAMGGASWPELGSDGRWVIPLRHRGVDIAAFEPSNCGFQVGWSEHFRQRFARQPVKSVKGRLSGPGDRTDAQPGDWHSGELMVTDDGLEGGLMYALSANARDQVKTHGQTTVLLDLNPGRSEDDLATRLAQPRGSRSMARHLRSKAGIEGVKAGLLREFGGLDAMNDPVQLAHCIKQLPVPLGAPFDISRAISSAGGVRFGDLTEDLMLKPLPGVFCAGEMLDWEAPTGGYLLTGCLASGWVAGTGVVSYLQQPAVVDR
ncbi:TIGR03862 family flavoprotein [uncultured Marinobacter sp.]|uniref:TIGR03862 family flavoprotein n=1 Tax=uncultured Marinobacter sp. TaxID=187379 RepID=UPI0030DA483E